MVVCGCSLLIDFSSEMGSQIIRTRDGGAARSLRGEDKM